MHGDCRSSSNDSRVHLKRHKVGQLLQKGRRGSARNLDCAKDVKSGKAAFHVLGERVDGSIGDSGVPVETEQLEPGAACEKRCGNSQQISLADEQDTRLVSISLSSMS